MIELQQETQHVRVLIVESYKITRIGLRQTLNQYENIEVIAEATSASEAISLIDKLHPDVVLMDLVLFGMNGLEATLKIKEKAANTKIVILTSNQNSKEVINALGAGANAYCSMNIAPETLSLVINSVAKGACWIDPFVASTALSVFPKPQRINDNKQNSERPKINLTEREREVLKHLVAGKSNSEIAKELIVSVHTAKAHVCSILQKMYVEDRVQAAVLAVKENLI